MSRFLTGKRKHTNACPILDNLESTSTVMSYIPRNNAKEIKFTCCERNSYKIYSIFKNDKHKIWTRTRRLWKNETHQAFSWRGIAPFFSGGGRVTSMSKEPVRCRLLLNTARDTSSSIARPRIVPIAITSSWWMSLSRGWSAWISFMWTSITSDSVDTHGIGRDRR